MAMEPTVAMQVSSDEPTEQVGSVISPVPMSFPAILRNAKLADRFAHLRESSVADDRGTQQLIPSKKRSRDEKEGKRWVRRRENARFTNNPHVVPASSQDVQINPPSIRRTFVSRVRSPYPKRADDAPSRSPYPHTFHGAFPRLRPLVQSSTLLQRTWAATR